MLKNRTLVCFLMLILFGYTAQAQFEEKAYSLGEMSLLQKKSTFSKSIFSPSPNTTFIGISGSAGKMLNDRVYLNVKPTLSHVTSVSQAITNLKSVVNELGVGLDMRYYLKPDIKTKFYIEGGAEYVASTVKPHSQPSNSYYIATVNLGIGANRFISSDISVMPYFKGLLTKTTEYENGLIYGGILGAQLQNFIGKSEIDKSRLTQRKRQIIDLNTYIYAGSCKDCSGNAAWHFSSKWGMFVFDNLLVKATLTTGIADGDWEKTKLIPSISYFIPIISRFYVVPEGTYSIIADEEDYFSGQLGLNYFLTQNTALKVDLFSVDMKRSTNYPYSFGFKCGINYFLK